MAAISNRAKNTTRIYKPMDVFTIRRFWFTSCMIVPHPALVVQNIPAFFIGIE